MCNFFWNKTKQGTFQALEGSNKGKKGEEIQGMIAIQDMETNKCEK